MKIFLLCLQIGSIHNIFSDDSFSSRSEQKQEDASSDTVNVLIEVILEAACCVTAEVLGRAFSQSFQSLLQIVSGNMGFS